MVFMKYLVGIYNLPLLVTMLGLISALSACMLSFNHRLNLAMACFVMAGLCDLFDGFVARRLKTTEEESVFGLYIDSTVDAVNFGAVPVVLLLHWGFNSWPDYLLFIFYCSCAVIRLAYFNLLQRESQGPFTHYMGLPVTYSSLFIPIVMTIGTALPGSVSSLLVRVCMLALGFFFVLKIPIKKPGGVFYLFFSVLGLLVISFWLLRAFN